MIEAVNSVLQTAPFVRSSTDQTSTADSFAANPERVQKAPQAPYVSPYIYVDVNYDKAVVQLRNGDTGDVIDQFPSESTLQARARQAASQAEQQKSAAPAPQPQQSQQSEAPQQPSQQQVQQAQTDAAITAQQQAAFQNAAQSGVSNAGNVTLFA